MVDTPVSAGDFFISADSSEGAAAAGALVYQYAVSAETDTARVVMTAGVASRKAIT